MNQNQKRIITIVISVIIAMLLFPPFLLKYGNGTEMNMGYNLIFNPPERYSISASVNSQLLLMQWIGVLLVGGLALFLTKNSSTESRSSNTEEVINKNPPSGVGGWLTLLIVGMMILGPLAGVGRISNDVMAAEKLYPAISSLPEWNTYKTVMWGGFIAFAALSFYGGWGLAYDRGWSAVSMARTILWVTGPVASIILGALVPMAIFKSTNIINTEFIGHFIASVIVTAIWSLYLYKSKRVRNTYSN